MTAVGHDEMILRLKNEDHPKEKTDPEIIDFKIDSVDKFYNQLDPAIHCGKELSPDLENYILSAAGHLPMRKEWLLVIYLQREETKEQKDFMKKSVHLHFSKRAETLKNQAAKKTKRFYVNAVFALLFLGICLTAAYGLTTISNGADFYEILAQGLTVIAWVAFWNPVEYLLYDRWEPGKEIAVSEKLGNIEIEIVPYPDVV